MKLQRLESVLYRSVMPIQPAAVGASYFGFKAFDLGEANKRAILGGMFGHVWKPGWNDAVCRSGNAPPCTGVYCTPGCGFYSMKKAKDAYEYSRTSGAWGMIGLGGTVVEHGKGWRSAQAIVLGLAVWSNATLYLERDFPDIPIARLNPQMDSQAVIEAIAGLGDRGHSWLA